MPRSCGCCPPCCIKVEEQDGMPGESCGEPFVSFLYVSKVEESKFSLFILYSTPPPRCCMLHKCLRGRYPFRVNKCEHLL